MTVNILASWNLPRIAYETNTSLAVAVALVAYVQLVLQHKREHAIWEIKKRDESHRSFKNVVMLTGVC
jgi:uncharacterized protein YpmB